MTKPDYSELSRVHVQDPGGELRPLTIVSEIVPNLFQGVRPFSYSGYDLVVSCEQFLAKSPMDGWSGMLIHIPMVDDNQFVIPQVEIAIAYEAIDLMLSQDKRVLVHCSGGLNRSSLVTGYYLKTGLTPKDAVALIRAQRDPWCLCNKAFERWVLEEQLPTAETSTFREGAEGAESPP